MAELPRHPRGPADDMPGLDHPSPQSCADDRRDRRMRRPILAEMGVMGVEGGRVAVVVVDDRNAQTTLERAADVEAVPGWLREIRGAFRGDHSIGAGRPGGPEADGAYRLSFHARQAEHTVEGPDKGLDSHFRPFAHAARTLEQPVHEETARVLQHRRAVGVASVVKPDDYPRARVQDRPSFVFSTLTASPCLL